GEAFRDPEMALVVRAEDGGGVAAVGRRAAADVDRDVVDLALQHADQLALRVVRPLVMQAAQHAAPRTRDVVLDEPGRQAVLAEALRVPALVDPAALVAEHRRLDHHAAGQAGPDRLHSMRPCSSRPSRYGP